jgi:hypothetical protein
MATDLDIGPIIWDFLHPFSFRKGRRFSFSHLLWTIISPAAVAIWLSFKYPVIDPQYQVTLLTVFGLIAAVMTSLLPVVQYVVGLDIPKERYPEAKYAAWEHQVVRLNVLRSLYATISFSVILLVFSLVPLIFLQTAWIPPNGKQVISASIYFVGLAVSVSFLQVISGVYLVLEAQAREYDQKLRDLAPPDNE